LFGFLPAAVLGFAVAGRLGRTAGAVWLVIASLVFYGFWQPALVVLISASILFNYAIASLIRRNEGCLLYTSRCV